MATQYHQKIQGHCGFNYYKSSNNLLYDLGDPSKRKIIREIFYPFWEGYICKYCKIP